jgi:hypothetical protein
LIISAVIYISFHMFMDNSPTLMQYIHRDW